MAENAKAKAAAESLIVLTLEANPLSLCTSKLDGTEVHRVILTYDQAISLAGGILVVAQHERMVSTGKIKSTTINQDRRNPLFTVAQEVN